MRVSESKCPKCGLTFSHSKHTKSNTCAICEPPLKSRKKGSWSLGSIIFVFLFAIPGFLLQKCSYSKIAEIRSIERIPRTIIGSAVKGEINVTGKVQTIEKGRAPLLAPYTKSPCVYYSYKKEEERRDSDGDTHWVTIESEAYFADFVLRDSSGSLLVKPSEGIDFDVKESFRRRSGRYRWTEKRIDPNDRIFTIGYLRSTPSETDPSTTNGGLPILSYTEKGDYQAIISEHDELHSRTSRAGTSVWTCWGGLGLLAAASCALFSFLPFHRILVFFAILSTSLSLILFSQGFFMMRTDLTAAEKRIERQEPIVKNLISNTLQQSNYDWDGDWTTLGDISSYEKIPSRQRSRLRRARVDLSIVTSRAQAQQSSFPYNIVALINGVSRPPEIVLPKKDQKFLNTLEKKFKPTRQISFWTILWSIVAFAGTLFFFFHGFGRLIRKRLIENLPTTPVAGLNYGAAEITGMVHSPPSIKFLTTPIIHTPVVYYHYVQKEKRGSGKNARWVTLVDEKDSTRFFCRDRSGDVLVDPSKAKYSLYRSHSHSRGRISETVQYLAIGDPLYAIGHASLDPETGDRLILGKPETALSKIAGKPFLLSNKEENRILHEDGNNVSFSLTLTFSSILLLGLQVATMIGSFNPATYLAIAMVGPLMMAFYTILLHYNDIVFMRARARRAWSNIEVALKKRHDLIPNLNEVVQHTLDHEHEVHEAIANLRTHGKVDLNDFTTSGERPQEARAASETIIALAENYPNLKSNQNMLALARQLTICENEIAYSTSSYNDSVEFYNTRISTLPDMLLAKIGNFKEMPLMHSDAVQKPIKMSELLADNTPDAPESESSQNTESETIAEEPSTPPALPQNHSIDNVAPPALPTPPPLPTENEPNPKLSPPPLPGQPPE